MPLVTKAQTVVGEATTAVAPAYGAAQAANRNGDNNCHPPIDLAKPQFIVGYGSLMQTASKRSTEPDAGENLPVLVTGFQRAWNTHGVYPTCYLGVQRSSGAAMVAALYRSFPEDGKLSADAREIDYCRASVAADSVKMLDASSVPADSQIWIYVNKPETLKAPDEGHPIVQSYVDIVIIGCMELQQRVADPEFDFVEQCIKTTAGWSKHWVNDRLYPRRPYTRQPQAFQIDQHLQRLLPRLMESVRIE
ncbi:MAG: hypothetical protein N838_18710 [Thiohalocapsa sp. PB-PSB1]|nr:MAG: hypothetical protein N838_18710 [Thiohalocapsa sp. PB-PSB1]